jgi:ribosomal protein S18 acetylase RimI-like enzyme
MLIRRAVASDAVPLAALAERTFRDAFAADNAPEDIDCHCATSYGPAQQLAEILDAGLETWVADDAGRLVAYAQLRSHAPSSLVVGVRQAEVARFYVLAEHHGAGLAHRLMDQVLTRAAEVGADVAWLGVWQRNPRAISFYRKWGFEIVGEHTFRVGSDLQLDFVMRRRTGGAATRKG